MPNQTKQIDLRDLPEDAQREVYDFYLFVKQQALEKQSVSIKNERLLFEWERV